MRPWTSIRRALSGWLLLAVAVLGLNAMLSGYPIEVDYGPSLVGSFSESAKFIIPLSAGAAAYLTGEIAASLRSRSRARSVPTSLLPSVFGPVLATAVAAMLLCLTIELSRSEVTLSALLTSETVVMLGMLGLVLVVHVAVGAAVGWLVPPVVAGPLVVLGSILWLMMPPAQTESVLTRQLIGMPVGCCDIDGVPSIGALTAAATVAAVWLAGSFVALLVRSKTFGACALVLGLILGATSGGTLTDRSNLPNPYLLEVIRPDETICRGAGPEVCLWPEIDDATRVGQLSRDVYGAWDELGLEAPATFSAYDDGPGGSAYLDHRPWVSDAQVVSNLADAVIGYRVRSGEMCVDEPGSDIESFEMSREAVRIWLTRRAGVPAEDVAAMYGESADRLGTSDLLARADIDQIRWFDAEMSDLQACR